MPAKPWKRDEAAERSQAGRTGWVNAVVLIALVVAVAAAAVTRLVPPGQWENLRRELPARWEALRALLRGEDPGHRDLVPLASPTPPAPTLTVAPGPPLPDKP